MSSLKYKVSSDGVTPLRKDLDTSPGGLDVIRDKSCNVQRSD